MCEAVTILFGSELAENICSLFSDVDKDTLEVGSNKKQVLIIIKKTKSKSNEPFLFLSIDFTVAPLNFM